MRTLKSLYRLAFGFCLRIFPLLRNGFCRSFLIVYFYRMFLPKQAIKYAMPSQLPRNQPHKRGCISKKISKKFLEILLARIVK